MPCTKQRNLKQIATLKFLLSPCEAVKLAGHEHVPFPLVAFSAQQVQQCKQVVAFSASPFKVLDHGNNTLGPMMPNWRLLLLWQEFTFISRSLSYRENKMPGGISIERTVRAFVCVLLHLTVFTSLLPALSSMQFGFCTFDLPVVATRTRLANCKHVLNLVML